MCVLSVSDIIIRKQICPVFVWLMEVWNTLMNMFSYMYRILYCVEYEVSPTYLMLKILNYYISISSIKSLS
jgi:hypothetical protein